MPDSIILHKFLPRTVLIRHGESHFLNYICPLILKRIILNESNKIDTEISDVSNLQHVICNIGYNQMQLLSDRKELGNKMIDRVVRWSNNIQKSIDISIPK